MINSLFTVRDVKSGSYSAPFTAPLKGAAIRMFSDSCSDEKTMLAKHPEDFQLFEVGTWDDNSGAIVAITPVLVASATDFVKANDNDRKD